MIFLNVIIKALKQQTDPARYLQAVTKLRTCVIPFEILVSPYIKRWCSVLLFELLCFLCTGVLNLS